MSGPRLLWSARGAVGRDREPAAVVPRGLSGCQRADLDQVVGQDPVSDPDPGAVGAVDPGSVPAVVAFECADPAFDAGPPFHGSAERSSVFHGPAGCGGFALAGNDDVPHAQVAQRVIDALLAVAAVGGDLARWSAGPAGDPLHGRGELGCVGGVALLDVVVDDHAVVALDELGLVAELHRLAQPALGDRAGVGVVQADPTGRPVGDAPAQALASLRRDRA